MDRRRANLCSWPKPLSDIDCGPLSVSLKVRISNASLMRQATMFVSDATIKPLHIHRRRRSRPDACLTGLPMGSLRDFSLPPPLGRGKLTRSITSSSCHHAPHAPQHAVNEAINVAHHVRPSSHSGVFHAEYQSMSEKQSSRETKEWLRTGN